MATVVASLGTKKSAGLAERKRVVMVGLANNTLSLTKAQTGLDVMEAVLNMVPYQATATAVTLVLTTFNADTAIISAMFWDGDSANCTVYSEVLGYRNT